MLASYLESLKTVVDYVKGLIKKPVAKPAVIVPKKANDVVVAVPDNAIAWKYIVVHHSLSKDSKVSDWEGIKKWHMGKSGSSDPKSEDYNPYIEHPMLDIGYHYGIELVGENLEIKVGRSLAMTGGHAGVKGVSNEYNIAGLGICLIGDYDAVPPSSDQYVLLSKLCAFLMAKFNITIENVMGHRDVYDRLKVPRQKTCPGTKFDLDLLRGIIQEY